MTKKIILCCTFILCFLAGSLRAEETTHYLFRHNMHQIFDNFKNAQISVKLKKYDIADIYLKHMQENIAEASKYMPEKNKDNAKLDKEQFRYRLDQLNLNVSALRGSATKWGELKDTTQLSQDIFNSCVGCHKESRLKHLFKGTPMSSLFGDYMHMVSHHMELAVISTGPEVDENLMLISYYMDLLKETIPGAGPSGIVMDRKDFDNRLKGIRDINEDMLKKAKDKKPIDMDAFRKSLNSFCVICHEPERIK